MTFIEIFTYVFIAVAVILIPVCLAALFNIVVKQLFKWFNKS